jgi:hypothetical protein
MPLMSVTEYARHRSVSHQAVSKAIDAGRIKKERNGKIDSDKADASWALRTDPVRSMNNAPRQHAGATVLPAPSRPAVRDEAGTGSGTEHLGFGEKVALRIAMQRLRRETAQADTAEMERDEKKNALMKRSDVDEHIAFFSQMGRDHCMAMPDRLAPAIAAVSDTATVHRIMKTDIDAVLRKLSKAVASAGF